MRLGQALGESAESPQLASDLLRPRSTSVERGRFRVSRPLANTSDSVYYRDMKKGGNVDHIIDSLAKLMLAAAALITSVAALLKAWPRKRKRKE